MADNKILAEEIDMDKLAITMAKIEDNSLLIDEVVNHIVSEYCAELDEYMDFVRELLKSENPPTALELDDWTLNLPVLLYFTSNAQEAVGVKEDVAKAVKLELYNQSYRKQAGTIPARQSAAELAAQYEAITHMAYSRAYKKIKERVNAAYELLNSVKKVITRRMQEKEISNVDPKRYTTGGENVTGNEAPRVQ